MRGRITGVVPYYPYFLSCFVFVIKMFHGYVLSIGNFLVVHCKTLRLPNKWFRMAHSHEHTALNIPVIKFTHTQYYFLRVNFYQVELLGQRLYRILLLSNYFQEIVQVSSLPI